MKISRKKIAKYINKQNVLIDKAKENKLEKCSLLEIEDERYKAELIYYYTEMIGYKVIDDEIYFKHINFLQDDNLFTEYVIERR